MTHPMTIEVAVDLAEKARSIGPNLLLLVNDRHEALSHAELAYSALVVVTDQLRQAETVILQLLETNQDLRTALIGIIGELPTQNTPPPTGPHTIEFRTDTTTAITNFPEIAAMLTKEISDTFGG